MSWGEADRYVVDDDECSERCDRYLEAEQVASDNLPKAVAAVLVPYGAALAAHVYRRRTAGLAVTAPPRTGPVAATVVAVAVTASWLIAAVT